MKESDGFTVQIGYSLKLMESLNLSQRKRLDKKLLLVEKAALHLARNMLKGIHKYSSDAYSVKQWIQHAKDDAVDTVNYLHLLEEKEEESSHGT